MVGVAAAGVGGAAAADGDTTGVAGATVAEAVTFVGGVLGAAVLLAPPEPPPHAARISASASIGAPKRGLKGIA